MSIKSSVTQENILESRRTRVLTEKAKEQYEQTLTRFKDKLSSAWGKCQSELDNVMCTSDDNVDNLKKVRLSLSIVYGGYCMISDEFMSYMDTINSAESQSEVAHHATNFKRSDFIVNNVLKQIDVKISSAEYETRSNRSSRYSDHSGRTSRHSDRISQHSNSSSDAARRRAKADAAKVRVAYVQKEAELRKHQALIEQEEKLHLAKLERQKQELNADMYVLQERKNCAAAEAEADAFETISAAGESIHIPAHLNVPVVDTVLRTEKYVNSLTNIENGSRYDTREPNIENLSRYEAREPHFENMSRYEARQPNIGNVSRDEERQPNMENVSQNELRQPVMKESTVASELSQFLLKKDLIFSRLHKFHDSPENYAAWRTGFCNIMDELNVSPPEELDLLIRWLGPELVKHATSIRAASTSNPVKGLSRLWDRLNERYGSPQMVESALKTKLNNFPKITNKEFKRLYELADILSEIESAMENPTYRELLSYFNTTAGINPIVSKLPHNIQEKWTNHAVRYRKQFDVVFPPFSCFTEFVREMSQIKNDPGFVYDNDTAKDSSIQKQDRNPVSHAPAKKRGNQSAPHVSTFKTEISPKGNMESIDSSSLCPLHHTGHSLNSCRQFRSKPIGVRRKYLKEKRYCFKCCDSTDHVYKNCLKNITCNVCQSTEHPGALHFDGGEKSSDKEPVKTVTIPHNEKVTANCTRINNASGRSKSCAKILMVNVHPTQEPQNTVKMYALLDEQSNRSLVRPAFFQLFDKKYETVNYSLSTCSGLASATGRKACDFTVSALDGSFNADLPCLLECDNIPKEREEIPTPDVALSYPHLSDLAQYIPDLDPSVKIVMLLGRDIPEVHHVQDQRIGPSGSPYAQQLHLGWTIIGETCLGTMHRPDTVNVNKTYLIKDRPSLCKPCPFNLRVKERAPSDTTAHDECEHSIFQRTRDDEKLGFSREDQEFLKIMDRDFTKDLHGRWTAPLPFKPHRPRLPNNKSQAVKRAHILDNTLRKDPIKRAHFITFMQKLFEQKHAELAPPLHDGQECWYLPIFGVYHPKKRDQIRGVFDSSAKHDGLSLNNVLMSGPDMTNNLPGILLRFRREQVAVTADVQQMFYNFFVCEDHRNFLRFLWYQDNDMSKDLVEYRMCVHVFGNTPSPAVATYGLRRTACENADNFGYDKKEFVEQDFYVDDGLMSLPSAPEAIDLMKRTQQPLATAGIRLHKVASNSTQVLKSFPQEDLAKDLKDLEIGTDSLPVQHSLGLSWDLESDSFLFRISPDNKPYTRRGVLSVTNSLFDPLGFIAPVAIGGKILLRSMTTGMFDWDETLPSKFYNEWERWRDSLHDLQDLRIPRQYTSSSFKECENISVHVFSDASEKAIASVGYLLTACEDGTQELGFILGKTKVAPLHTTTIPRLELCAAVLAIEIAETISEQLNLPLSIFHFYTDSKVVLGYVYNQTRRFYNYVCNRVTRIRKSSTPEQWNFVSTEHNPADQGTRPIHAKDLLESKWLHGPTFLLEGTEFSDDLVPEVSADDKEVRPEVSCLLTKAKVSGETILKRCEKFSNWHQLVTAMGTLIKLARRIGGGNLPSSPSCLESFSRTQTFILQLVQRDTFPTEIECLSSGNPCPRDSRISALNPFLDQHGLLRVGGRLKHAKIDTNEKYPIIIPSAHHISTLIVRHYHEQMKHQGRHLTEGSIRSAGFWIVGGKRLISSIIHKCVTCRKFRGKEGNQIMSDLPKDRVVPGPPFSSVGVDVFGPWNVVARRTRGGVANSKRWAVLYTCLTTRAIHIEVVEELSTSAFINATRRFIAIRGKVTEFRSDRGTNFVGATDLMRIDAVNVEDGPLKEFLFRSGTVWIFNPPHSSHMGGVWERMIGVVRRILDSMLYHTTTKDLTHDVITTFMAEVTAMVNARPLLPVSTDPDNPTVLSPSMLLTQKPAETGQYITDTNSKDMYRAHWRRVQALANVFWKRWRLEFLQSLQQRRKWTVRRRDMQHGDIVLVIEKDSHRNNWPMGIVKETFPGDDGHVRTVTVQLYRNDEQKIKNYVRPITELIVLLEKENQ